MSLREGPKPPSEPTKHNYRHGEDDMSKIKLLSSKLLNLEAQTSQTSHNQLIQIMTSTHMSTPSIKKEAAPQVCYKCATNSKTQSLTDNYRHSKDPGQSELINDQSPHFNN